MEKQEPALTLPEQIEAIQIHASRARLWVIDRRQHDARVLEEMQAIIAAAERVCRVVEKECV